MNIFITPLWSISYNRERRILVNRELQATETLLSYGIYEADTQGYQVAHMYVHMHSYAELLKKAN